MSKRSPSPPAARAYIQEVNFRGELLQAFVRAYLCLLRHSPFPRPHCGPASGNPSERGREEAK